MKRVILSLAVVLFAIGVILAAWLSYTSPIEHTSFGVRVKADGNDAVVFHVVRGQSPLHVGDRVLLSRLGLGRRMRLELYASPAGTQLPVDVVRGGVASRVVLVARAVPESASLNDLIDAIVLTLSIVIVLPIALFRPSVVTVSLVFIASGPINAEAFAKLFAWLPDAWYGPVAIVILALFGYGALFALLIFVTRFPDVPASASGRMRMRIGDLAFLSYLAFAFCQGFEPLPGRSWYVLDIAVQLGCAASIVVLSFLAYRELDGNARRRMTWVVVGFALVELSAAFFTLELTLFHSTFFDSYGELLDLALPLAIAYAVLRHRVIDISFALNRTLVYGGVTAVVIGLLSLLDWASSRFIGEQRLATIVEAAVTIGIGFALEWIHRQLERFVDRVIFRAKHRSEQQLHARIAALGFAAQEQTIDETLACDAPAILGLASAACFIADPSGTVFARRRATGWAEVNAEAIAAESVLVRTMRALERPFFLNDYAIDIPHAPAGAAQPVVVVPLTAQHQIIGFVLYGAHRDGATPDPDDISLLHRLGDAGSAAYGAVESRRWRERAISLEASLGPA